MITYNMVLVTEQNKSLFRQFFYTHFKQEAYCMDSFITNNQYKYMTVAYDDLKLIGLFPVVKLSKDREDHNTYGEVTDNHYSYTYAVVHLDHRNKGLCNGILRMAVKLLIDVGADKIRVAKSSLNNVKHTIFTDMGFDLINFDDTKTEFKHIYELDVSKADMNKLNEIWSKYVEIKK